LKLSERREVALLGKDLFHCTDTEGSDQFVLEIGVAHIKPATFQLAAAGDRAQPHTFETLLEETHLGAVAETGQPDVQTARAEFPQKVGDVGRALHRQDSDTLGEQVAIPAPGECRHRKLVADPSTRTTVRGPTIASSTADLGRTVPVVRVLRGGISHSDQAIDQSRSTEPCLSLDR